MCFDLKIVYNNKTYTADEIDFILRGKLIATPGIMGKGWAYNMGGLHQR